MEMDSNLVETAAAASAAAAAAAASTASSTGNPTGVSGVSDRFPVGLRVLVVDDDPICLKILERMLMNCLYEVTTCSRAIVALSMLRERKDGFDLVISDVYMPDMDGFKLLEYIGLEMDLPVIMMSAADGKDVVMKGVTHGACDYLIKPVRMEAIKNIWQHVIRKKRNEMKELEQSGSFEDSDKHKKSSEDGDYASSVNEENWRNSKRRKEEEDEGEEREDSSSLKKPRVVWSVELHQQFVAAVNQLGVEKAVPKKILELMNVPGLTRENVASHLQKFRLYLRRIKPGTQHHGGLNNDFVGSPDANFNPFVSLDGLDLHALAVSGQLPPQNLVNIDGNRRPIVTSGMGMSIIDQVNLFNPDLQIANSSKIRYGSAQHISSKQLSLLHGFPIAMDPKLAHVHQPLPSLGSMGLQINEGARSGFLNLPTQRQYPSANMHQVLGSDSSPSMMHMTQNRQHYPTSQNANQIQGGMFQQSKSREELLNEIAGGSAPGFPSERQQIISNEVAGQVIGRNGPVVNGLPSSQGACFSNNSSYITVSQPSINLPKTQDTKLPRDGFPLTGRSGIFQGAVSKTSGLEGLQNENGLKGTRPPIPQFDIFNEFHPHKNQDWELQHTNLSCKTTQIINLPNNPSFGQGHQGLTGSQENRENRDGHGNTDGIDKDEHYLLGDSSVRVKAVGLTNLNSDYMLLNEHFGQGDVINSHFKQKQEEEIEPVETEFCLDGFHMDDILV